MAKRWSKEEIVELEKIWLSNVDHLKINTGLLTSGNMEIFRYER